MTDEPTYQAEEGVVDELLAGRWDPNEILRPVGGDETQKQIRRECLEVLGLLPQGLAPRTPSAALKQQLMANVAILGSVGTLDGLATGAEPQAGQAPPPSREETLPVEVTRDQSVGERAAPAPVVPAPQSRPQPRSAARWLLPLAATVAFVALGVVGWQVLRVADLEKTVARQARDLEAARVELDGIGAAADALARANAKLAVLTSPGSEFCALKPGRDSRMRLASGTLVMHPDADRWFMKVVGLEPSSEGFRYQLWYLTGDGAVAAASFGFDSPDAVVEVMPERGPAGVQAVMITLEPPGSAAPSSPALLYGDERMRIL